MGIGAGRESGGRISRGEGGIGKVDYRDANNRVGALVPRHGRFRFFRSENIVGITGTLEVKPLREATERVLANEEAGVMLLNADELTNTGVPSVLYADLKFEITKSVRERYLEVEGEMSGEPEE